MARKSELAKRLSALAMAALVTGSSVVSDMSGITAFAAEPTTATLLKGGGNLSSGFRHQMLEAAKKADSSITTDDAAAKAIRAFKPYFESGSSSTAPSDLSTNWTLVSSTETSGKAYILYQNGTIWYWSDSATTYLSKNSAGMFYQLPNLKEVDLSGLDATQAYNMQLMFSGDSSLTTISGIEFNNAINVQGLFQDCESLTSIDLSSFQADVLDANGMEMMLDGSGVTIITLDDDFDFVSKTGIDGNWTKDDDSSIVWSADELEALYKGTSSSEGIPNAGTYVKTSKAATKSEVITESGKEYFEATKVTDDDTVFNIWNIESPSAKFTAFCIDNQWTSADGTKSVGHGAPYGYYKKEVATIQNLKNGTKAREKDVDGSGLNSNVMSTQGYLNSDNYGSAPLGTDMVQALTALVYFGPTVYGGSDGIINTKAEYDKLQAAIWHFTNDYSSTWADEALWSNYHYTDIPEEYRNSTKLYIYVSEATAQNLVAVETSTKSYKIAFLKTDANDDLLAGAQLKVTGTDIYGNDYSNTMQETKGGNTIQSLDLYPGTYKVSEVKVPDGYQKASDISFTIAKDGTVTSGGKTFSPTKAGTVEFAAAINVIDLYDTEFEISKTEITGEAEIADAKLKITGTRDLVKTTDWTEDAEEDVEITPITWTSEEGKSKKVKLQPGAYTLTETTAPAGYATAEAIDFSVVLEDGKLVLKQGGKTVDKIVMKDELLPVSTFEVRISKKDVAGNEIEGAKLQILKADGNEVKSWTSGKAATTVKLEAGTYTLKETLAPSGYKKSESISFTVTEEGKVSVNGETVDAVAMTDEYQTHDVVLSKVDVAGNEIVGAKIVVSGTQFDGKKYEASYTSDGTKHTLSVPQGSYTMTETTAPDGFEKAESIDFTVDANGKVTINKEEVSSVVMTDEYANQTVSISKRNVAGNEIEGATIVISGVTTTGDEKDSITFTTSAKDAPHEVKLPAGTYTLTETTVPDGYVKSEQVKFTLDDKGNVTLVGTNGAVDGKTVIMTDNYKYNKVRIAKVNFAGSEVDGAVLTITGKTFDGKEIDAISWTSKKGEEKYVELAAGSYTLTETTTPSGYKKAESIAFTVDKTGKVTVNGKDSGTTVTMTDEYNKFDVVLSKVDVAGNELSGAKITVKGTAFDGSAFEESYTSDGKKHTMKIPQGSYTMTETSAPSGFETAESIAFNVDASGKVTVSGKQVASVVMTDKTKTKTVTFKKVNSNGKLLKGAEIKITGKDITGREISAITYTSTENDAYRVALAPGSYTMQETKTPDGYDTANNIDFTVSKDLVIKIGDKTVTEIVMTDVESTKSATVYVTKAGVDGKALSGAKLVVYYGASDGTQKTAASWTTDSSKKALTLEGGKTYTLHEAEAPSGYIVADDIKFTVAKDGTVTVNGKTTNEITMTDKYTTVTVKKVDSDGKNLSGAKLQIKDSNGNVVDTWTTDGNNHTMKAVLKAGATYTLHEESAPNGYTVATDISFTVASSEKEQVITMKDSKIGESTAKQQTNKTTTTQTTTGSSGSSNSSSGSSNSSNTTTTSASSKTPATGDILFPFLIAGIVSFVAGLGLAFLTRKRREK